eukprot:1886508-Rhodomonas_salina.1
MVLIGKDLERQGSANARRVTTEDTFTRELVSALDPRDKWQAVTIDVPCLKEVSSACFKPRRVDFLDDEVGVLNRVLQWMRCQRADTAGGRAQEEDGRQKREEGGKRWWTRSAGGGGEEE